MLDSPAGGAYLREWRGGHCVRGTPFNPDEEPMGSTSFGNVTPNLTGPSMPQNTEINRAGLACVRVMVAPG